MRNTGKYCKYHDDGGHNTNVCIALKDMIESLQREGKLTQYRPRQAKEVALVQPPRGQIHTIDGDAKLGPTSQ